MTIVSLICFLGVNVTEANGSQLKNPDISGAIFALGSSKLILNSQCVEGARDVRVLEIDLIDSDYFLVKDYQSVH